MISIRLVHRVLKYAREMKYSQCRCFRENVKGTSLQLLCRWKFLAEVCMHLWISQSVFLSFLFFSLLLFTDMHVRELKPQTDNRESDFSRADNSLRFFHLSLHSQLPTPNPPAPLSRPCTAAPISPFLGLPWNRDLQCFTNVSAHSSPLVRCVLPEKEYLCIKRISAGSCRD